MLMSPFGNFMRDGASINKTPRELRAEKRSRSNGKIAPQFSENKQAKTKDKNLDGQNLAINLDNKNKRKLDDLQTFEPSKFR